MNVGQYLLAGKGTSGVFHGHDIQGFSNAVFGQQIRGKQFVRATIKYDSTLVHKDNSIHRPMEYVLKAVFYNDNGLFLLKVDFMD